MNKHSTQTDLRRWTAALLAVSVLDLFPDAQLVSSWGDRFGFYADFLFRTAPDQGLLDQIQERMRYHLSERTLISSMRMLRTNAISFLKDHKQKQQAKMLSEETGQVVDLLKIGHFPVVCCEPHPQTLDDLGVHTLLKMEQHGALTRIVGSAFENKQLQKEFVKAYQKIHLKGHVAVGVQKGYFKVENNHVYWLPKGKELFDQYYLAWRQWVSQSNCQEVITPLIDFDSYKLRNSIVQSQLPLLIKNRSIAEYGRVARAIERSPFSTLLDYPISSEATTTALVSVDEAYSIVKSSLQSICETIRMSPIKAKWALSGSYAVDKKRKHISEKWALGHRMLKQALSEFNLETTESSTPAEKGPKIALQIQDHLGRFWTGPSVEVDILTAYQCQFKVPDNTLIIHSSLFGPIERMIALHLELSGDIPSFAKRTKTDK